VNCNISAKSSNEQLEDAVSCGLINGGWNYKDKSYGMPGKTEAEAWRIWVGRCRAAEADAVCLFLDLSPAPSLVYSHSCRTGVLGP